ncbi:MAG: hypothetical protein ACRDL7_06385, partial [Gaiellaceae bacterium]
MNQGITMMEDLNLVGKDDVKRICKIIRENNAEIVITFMQQQLLESMRYWVSTRTRRGLDIAATLFNRDVANESVKKMLIDSAEMRDKTESAIKSMPDKFKNESSWNVFKDAVDTYLSQLKGGDRIPLNYVIRDNDDVDNEAHYENDVERLISTVPLRGEHYNRDTIQVYSILKLLVLEGPGWNWIIHLDRVRDGRAAWKALKAHYEGASVTSRTKDEAYKSIDTAQYNGERRNFTFETYTNIHQKAHQDLLRLGEPIAEHKKVWDYINNIHDPNLTAGKANILANNTLENDFTLASNYLANFVVRIKSSYGSERRVSMVDAGRGRFERGGRGRGCGRGRGRGRDVRGPRGGRALTVDVIDKHYPPAEWAKLSHEQK